VFPGVGQLYSRHWVKGGLLLAIALSLLLYAVWSIFGATGKTVHGFWALGILIGLYSFNILDAYRGTQPDYGTRITVPRGDKDPWYAVFLSQILPGIGHLYVQQAIWGGLFLVCGLVTAGLAQQWPLLAPIPPAIWAFSCYHVYATFPHPSKRRQPTVIALLILSIFLARLILGNTPNWISQSFEQFIVPSDSMMPTLQAGDRLFMHRNARYHPQTGDIVIFEPPKALQALLPPDKTDALFVKRIIGIPGQRVRVEAGQVFVNNHPLLEDYIQSVPLYELPDDRVPSNHYFVLGDNRNQSGDSHIWGYVPRDRVLGKVYKIYWPPHRVRSLE
jgi:signal peptidase I